MGAAQTLLCLPGLDGTGDLFEPFLRKLPRGWRGEAVAYPTDRALDYDGLLDYVRARVPAADSLVVVAESFSGPLGARLAAERPPGLSGLVLVASFVSPPLEGLSAHAARLVSRLAFRVAPPRFALRWALTGGDDAMAANVGRAVSRVHPAVLAARVRAMLALDARDALRACSVPVLYLAGARDRLVRRASVDTVRAARPDVVTRELDAPHLVLQTAPAASVAAIRDWLTPRSPEA
ncbi:MAG: alpha/beta fold hydrolase [Planctomycetota bacterium]